MTTKVTTESGSVYYVREDAGRYYLRALNKPNPYSVDVSPEREWEVAPAPWPPVVGEQMLLLSVYVWEPGHPERIPGGGKYTSPVVRIEPLTSEVT